MRNPLRRISKKAGTMPGSVVYVGHERTDDVRIRAISYDHQNYREVETTSPEECFPFADAPNVTWLDVSGVHDVGLLQKLGAQLGLHALILEDIANTGHRPKYERHEEYDFVILKALARSGGESVARSQAGIVFGDNWVVSFRSDAADIFRPVRERMAKTVPRVRFMGSDYLAYALMDTVVDHYFGILEDYGDEIDVLEESLMVGPEPEHLERIHCIKSDLVSIRKAVWPVREVVDGFIRSESPRVKPGNDLYFRDIYEHAVQALETIESQKDTMSGLLDLYMSGVSNRMNEVMKVLTIIATIFIPLSFIAGVYGMNFDPGAGPWNMPELSSPYGYIGFWGMVVLVGIGLFWFFKKKRWL